MAIGWRRSSSLRAMQQQAFQVLGVKRSEDQSQSQVNREQLVFLLRKCGDLHEGRRLHESLRSQGLDSETFVGNNLVQMYGKCGSLEEARTAFDRISEKNVFSWSIIIGLYSRNKLSREAIQMFETIDVAPNEVTLINALSACCSEEFLETGRRIHSIATSNQSLDSQLNLGNALITMYSNCGSLEDSKKLFDGMRRRNVVSWNCLMAAFVHHGIWREALELFLEMERQGEKPDRVSFVTVFSACSSSKLLAEGLQFHSRFRDSGLKMDVSLANMLINMYAKCGSLHDSRFVFDGIHNKNVVSWTSMIAAYAQFGEFEKACELFNSMNTEPNEVTYYTILGACAEAGLLNESREIHCRILKSDLLGKHENALGNSLISTYSKCGSLQDARKVFDGMQRKNVVTWTCMVAAHVHCGQFSKALSTFHRMDLEGVKANEVTFCTVVSAASNLRGGFRDARLLHKRIVAGGHDRDIVICNGLINMYSKCRMLEECWGIFSGMRSRNVVSWTAMMGAHIQHQQTGRALELFREMDLEGVSPSSVSFVIILDGCSGAGFSSNDHLETAKSIHRSCISGTEMEGNTEVGTASINLFWRCNELEQAREAFNRIIHKDTMAWTAMVAAYAQSDCWREALELYERMLLEGAPGDEITFVNLMLAFSKAGAKKEGRMLHSHIVESGLIGSEVLGNALVCFYGVCGTWNEARDIFNRMLVKDVATWNAAIGVSGQHGFYDESLLLFQMMALDGVQPDGITFTNVLFSCSHVGDIETACGWFRLMSCELGIQANMEHWGCLIDLFGRSGWLSEAEQVARGLPDRAASVAWMTLLSGCKVHGELGAAERAAMRIVSLDPQKSAPYVVLSHIYLSQIEQ